MNSDVPTEYIDELIDYLDRYRSGRVEGHLSLVQICFANEINSAKYETKYKLSDLTTGTYDNYHYKAGNAFYEVFIRRDEVVDKNNMYQILDCDGYTQVVKFKEGDYDHRVTVLEFEHFDQKIYSFFNGLIIVAETEKGLNFKYKDIRKK